jgi:hypothetical protein
MLLFSPFQSEYSFDKTYHLTRPSSKNCTGSDLAKNGDTNLLLITPLPKPCSKQRIELFAL